MSLLRGEKVYLKLFDEEHIKERVNWINDPTVQDTLNYDIPTNTGKTKRWFDKMIVDPSRREFAIYTVEDNQYIGFCGLFNKDINTKSAELHCVIGNKNYWSGGYGTEVYTLLMNYGFCEWGLNRIYGYQLLHNFGAHRVVEKLGWTREGLLRQYTYSHGTLKDVYVVAILKSDWLKNE